MNMDAAVTGSGLSESPRKKVCGKNSAQKNSAQKKSAQKKAVLGIVACGALAREIRQVVKTNSLPHIRVRYLAAKLHNTPTQIPEALDNALCALAPDCDRLFAAYGDCGTAGEIDKILNRHGATRLAGAHCYEFFAGSDVFNALQESEPGTFYLTDYLTRQFDTLVYKALGLDRYPHLRDEYFSHYTRLQYLAQTSDPELELKARAAAKTLGLRFEKKQTGLSAIAQGIKKAIPQPLQKVSQ